MPSLLINIDVDDIERAIRFYTDAFELRVGRRFDAQFVELLGAEVPVYLLEKKPDTLPFEGADTSRSYRPHWTAVHLDLVVTDIDQSITRALAAGATLEQPAERVAYGRLALLRDPFGHGFCLLQFEGRGYDELVPS